PLQSDSFDVVVVDNYVDSAHIGTLQRRIRAAEEEDLAGPVLPIHLRQRRRPITGVVGSDIGIGLLELRMLAGGDRHISHDVQTVPAAGGPAGDDGDDDLRHGADEALDLEDVQAPGTSRIDTLTGLPG